MNRQKSTFAAGCFWGVEAKFRMIDGVLDAEVGYTGGHVENPTYRMVCSKRTGHAEAVQITYDADQISYETLVRAFFEMHNPISRNRQGWDIGSQYRSAIFYHNEEQKKIAENVKCELEKSGNYRKPFATEISPAEEFYRAEEYHQQYYDKQGYNRS
jgi:peptide-methionine (S)-S-oxide reductase